uniref:ARAD1D18040p n=1 Tax=Blastobotrys adeninivorans TaxID=409370 RepID=A0A060TEY4_BLAAD
MTPVNGFWNQRAAVTRTATLPAMYRQMKDTGRWDAMRMTWKKGDPNEPHIFWDSDIAKVVESACYALMHMDKSDPQYETFMAWIDDAIDMIKKAQGPDGYVNIYYTVVAPEKRWTDVAHQHELYCAGHLLEAAVAHHKLTGSNEFLDVMCKYIDYICTVFGPGDDQLHGYPGHPEIELALVRLLEVRSEKRYLDLLTYFVNERGNNGGEFYDHEAENLGIDPMNFIPGPHYKGKSWPDPPCHWYMQAEAPIRELKEIKGHSVRAMYLLAGVQGLANITKDKSLDQAVDRLWRNMVDTKMYINGGIGAVHEWEGFDKEYELPLGCYAETCASIGILFLGKRILERKLDGEIPSVMERALYNDVIGGVSLDGTSFYYDQPLVGRGLKRSSWFEVSCCPPNLARLLNSLDMYAFTLKDDTLAVNMWIDGKYKVSDGVKVIMKTDYPLQGKVELEVLSDKEIELDIHVPEDDFKSSISGNMKDGYLRLSKRKWNDKITIEYDMKPKVVRPDPRVEATKGTLAVERGPFVYGLEQSGSSLPVKDVSIPLDAKFEEEQVTIESTTVIALNHTLPSGDKVQLLPYFVLGNRVPGEDFVVFFSESR